MFFIFSKILAFVISPLSWIIALFVSALWLKDPRNKKRMLISGVAALLFFSNSFILDEFMRAWEVPAVNLKELGTCEVGIVLGGMAGYDETFDRVQFGRGVDRLLQSVELYRKGKIKKIFFVGGSGSILHPDHKEGIFVKRYLIMMGIPEADIIIETESRNTHENALFAKEMMDKQNIKEKVVLITSGFHLPRAIGCFEKEGIQVLPYSTDRYSGPRKFEFDYIIIPNSGALNNWDTFTHEIVGYITYYFSGYL